jgi:hypothetical protein
MSGSMCLGINQEMVLSVTEKPPAKEPKLVIKGPLFLS